jgi:parallel beta-helix repeat protein
MSFSSWLRNHTSAHVLWGRAAALRFRPQLDELEGRVVPSVLTVTNNNDHAAGSLRAAIAHAQNGDTVQFAPSLDGQTITLTSGELDIGTTKQPTTIQIEGPGDSQLAVSGGGSRVFGVGVNSQLILSGLTITGGRALYNFNAFDRYSLGGGIYNAGTLTVSGCTISNNVADIDGGGIYNAYGATLTVSGCTISNNVADYDGGGIYNDYGATLTVSGCTLSGNDSGFDGYSGGGIYNGGTAMVSNSTLSNNVAAGGDYGEGYGGGIYNAYRATLTVSGCTISNNFVEGVGGGIYNDLTNGYGTLTVSNTTFSGNSDNVYGGYGYNISGPYTDGGGNTFG